MLDVVEIQKQIEGSERVIPVGGGSKPALSASEQSVQQVSTSNLTGILAYDPSEFLITAYAGTPISELHSALGEKGQYLPFDPLFSDAGATLGGAIASGVSGPRQLLHGSVRDFVMEVAFVDGLGKQVRGGGRVVKNAAGFDFPKMMVGSLGRYGVLTDATVKVLPKPAASIVLSFALGTLEQAITASQKLLAQPLPISALEIAASGTTYVEFAGLPEAIESVRGRAVELLSESFGECDSKIEDSLPSWHLAKLRSDECLVKVACDPESTAKLGNAACEVPNTQLLGVSAAGKMAWMKTEGQIAMVKLDRWLRGRRMSGIVVDGSVSSLTCLGNTDWMKSANRIQQALDPHGKFLTFAQNAPTLKMAT